MGSSLHHGGRTITSSGNGLEGIELTEERNREVPSWQRKSHSNIFQLGPVRCTAHIIRGLAGAGPLVDNPGRVLVTIHSPSLLHHRSISFFLFFKYFIYLFIYLALSGLRCCLRDLRYGMWDLVP